MLKYSAIVIFCLFLFVSPVLSATIPSTIDLYKDYSGLLKIFDSNDEDRSLTSVAIGDLNGDGFKDLIIGSFMADPYEETKRTEAGTVFIVFGSASLLSQRELDLSKISGNVKIIGKETYDYLGRSVSSGDVNNDGYDDLVIGASNFAVTNDPNKGKAYIIFGSSDFSSKGTIDLSNPPSSITQVNGDLEIGISSSIGDANGDGIKDILLCNCRTGIAYIIKGSSNLSSYSTINLNNNQPNITKVYAENNSDAFGIGSASTDLNGDGYNDFIIGAWYASSDNNGYYKNASGKVYIIFGNTTLFENGSIYTDNDSEVTHIPGENSSDFLGHSITTGDLDKDGYGDVVIEAHGYDSGKGAVYLIMGSSDFSEKKLIDLSSDTNIVKIVGKNYGDGLSRGIIYDYNGDSVNDLVLVAPDATSNGMDKSGEAYILNNTIVSNNKYIDINFSNNIVSTILGDKTNGNIGFHLAVGDLNSDGYDELIFGSYDRTSGTKEKGARVFVFSVGIFTDNPIPPVNTTHFKLTSNTGNNAVILIKSEKPPKILGNAISIGDEIGVYTPGGLCAGAGRWDGNNLSITVWGDNTLEDGISGFLSEEDYNYKVWDESENKEYSLKAYYLQGNGKYLTDGISILSSLETDTQTLTIFLTRGWNLISSNVLPYNLKIESIISDIKEEVILVKNGKGKVFWPEYSINQINDWVITDGYQIYVENDCTLKIKGYKILPVDYQYSLNKGWNLISYIGEQNLNPLTSFYSIIENISVLKDGIGRVFWPEYGIDQIENMKQGKGYWIALKNPEIFNYINSSILKPTIVSTVNEGHFNPVDLTGNNATILIKKDSLILNGGKSISEGDEIGVFTPGGICVGCCKLKGDNSAFSIWGDDPMTKATDGLLENETFLFRVFDIETGNEYNVEAVFENSAGIYTANALIMVKKLITVGTSVENDGALTPGQISLRQNYPNPFNSSTAIKFSLPESCKVKLTVYNSIGAAVGVLKDEVLSAGLHTVDWNASGYPSGLYFYKLEAGKTVRTKRLMLLK